MGTSRVHWKQKLLLKIQERQEAEAPFGIAWPLTRRELVSAELNFSVLGHIAPSGKLCNVDRELDWHHPHSYAGASAVP
jgi:hypothetical protein